MKLILTKVCQGVIDTEHERQRIKEAFKGESEIRRRLTLLMDAIEAQDWKKAREMLGNKWWNGRDRKRECPRVEFIGMLNMMNPKRRGHPANGFDVWASYGDLADRMARKPEKGGVKYTVTLEGE